ncbi:hypothetical protein [Actinopolyspora mortivallis]|uniref:hypothetical protein n=1 Tax=Actinopolyspora mortivallis TaxID=33906 RepID=UPI0011B20879|nr:hypothetical protein [Actinopolyspora mortivallis]
MSAEAAGQRRGGGRLVEGYWAGMAHHGHVVPVGARPDSRGRIAALCGVLALPGEITGVDRRPVCGWCAEQVRTGRVRPTT